MLEDFRFTEDARREARTVASALGRLPIRLWLNDCPDCGVRMEFVLGADAGPVHRRCPACGTTVQAAQVLAGTHAEPARPAFTGRFTRRAALIAL